MNHILFELLENAGFLRGSTIDTDKIARAKRSELVSIAEQSAELTPTSSVNNVDSIFSHTASLSLGGGPTPCVALDCRTKRARELVQFAAFYSDRVFVNNNLFASSGRYQEDAIDEARSAFHDELEIVLILKPMIESGLIVPITPTTTLCYHCLGKTALPDSERKRFDDALRRFTKRFEMETEATLENYGDGLLDLSIRGNDDLVEHGSAHKDWGEIKSIAKAVDEHMKSKPGRLTQQDAEEIYKEVIEPELARLNQKVNTASKSLFKKSRAGILGWVAAISAGHYFGFLESGLIATAQALGLTKVAADLAGNLIGTSSEDSIRNEKMYFLWKVQHRAQRS